MHSAISLRQLQRGDLRDWMMTQDNQLTMQKLSEQLQELQERLMTVETRVLQLERPQLMYKPPQCQNYQTIAETLDDLHNAVRELQDGSTRE